MTALCVECALQRNEWTLVHATPLFAMLVPLPAYGGALGGVWAHATALCSLAALEVGAFVLAAEIYPTELGPLPSRISSAEDFSAGLPQLTATPSSQSDSNSWSFSASPIPTAL